MEIHHVALRTNDVAMLASFYEDVFGLGVVRRELPRSIWLGLANDAVLMIEARGADEPAIPEGSMELVAFRVDASTRAKLRERALARGCFDGETEFTVYLRDPDGRRVGVSTYAFPS